MTWRPTCAPHARRGYKGWNCGRQGIQVPEKPFTGGRIERALCGMALRTDELQRTGLVGFRGEYLEVQARCKMMWRSLQAINCPMLVIVPSPHPKALAVALVGRGGGIRDGATRPGEHAAARRQLSFGVLGGWLVHRAHPALRGRSSRPSIPQRGHDRRLRPSLRRRRVDGGVGGARPRRSLPSSRRPGGHLRGDHRLHTRSTQASA